MTSYSSGFWTSCMHILSTILSSNSMSVNSLATWRETSSHRPSEYFMMFALCTDVTFFLPLSRAYWNAYRTMRSVPITEMGFMLMPESGRISRPPCAFTVSIMAFAPSEPFSYSIPA